MLVSIIIPVYNVEKYLCRCLDSVIQQTHPELEIVLVDDGSQDNSGIICDEYKKKDSRVSVIHKPNGGLSSARNAGLDVVKGEYITFVDSDDYLSPTFVELALKLCVENDADISILKMEYINESYNDLISQEDANINTILLSKEQAIKESLYQRLYSCCAPGKLYKCGTLSNIRFPIGKLSEDLAVAHRIFDNSRRVVYQNSIGYYYRQQQESIMHTFNPRRLDALQWAKEIEAFCSEKYPDLIPAAKCRIFNVAVHLALDLPEDDISKKTMQYNKIWKQVKETRIAVIVDSDSRFREKAAAICSFFGVKFLKHIWNSKLAIKSNGN